jgi:16S rRNA (uracil1498-N3)-methyltransferase
MTAPHFFAPDVSGERVALEGDEARHASRVLRVRPGEVITISDGRGRVVTAIVSEAGAELVADVRERATEPPPRPEVVVFAAIPKAGKLDLVVQKLTELGVGQIRPFPAARSVSRWDDAKSALQTARLNAIAREAAKQSRRAWLPTVHAPAPLEASEFPRPSFVLDEEAEGRSGLGAVLPPEPPATVGLVVGPEGGLDREEVSALTARGVERASLGPLILRAETAALVAVAIVGVRYGRLG